VAEPSVTVTVAVWAVVDSVPMNFTVTVQVSLPSTVVP
jgi:hypothetical protein